MPRKPPYPREVRERATRMVFDQQGEYESQWAAITSIAEKFGMTAVLDLVRHGGALGLPVRRGADARRERLDDAAGPQRAHEPGHGRQLPGRELGRLAHAAPVPRPLP